MKTAISIPDDVYESAEQLAEQLGTSRSKLYARALRSYVSRHRDQDITQKINDLYAEDPGLFEPDTGIQSAAHKAIRAAEW